ncbi:sodium:calcium symporter [Pseudoalteromonas phage J2-1_QLiu-2017]|nr:sodium:calcium symporter [Pseudoalteromonas phage J2-1_QLiu-2017]
MDFGLLIQSLGICGFTMLVIMYTCNVFEQSSAYLGRNMQAGAKGGLIDAIGSSLPELLVTMAFVATGQPELILAGIAVTAGSAIYNACAIPALSILFAKDKDGNKVDSFELTGKVILRDGFWLLLIESVLILYLGWSEFTAVMAMVLIAIYGGWVAHVIRDSKAAGEGKDDYEYEEIDHTETPSFIAWIGKCLDFNKILFGNKPLTTQTAWVTLGLSVVVLAIACHYLAVGIQGAAEAFNTPVFIAAVLLGSAATSVPDTVLSVKSAQNGEGDDAVANAIGSNIFDVGPALAIPLLVATTPIGSWLFGLSGNPIPIEAQDALLTAMRYMVLFTSVVVIAALFFTRKNVNKNTAYILLGLLASWFVFVIYNAPTTVVQ